MKKTSFLLLAVVAALTLTACQGPSVDMSDVQGVQTTNPDQTNSQETTATGEITTAPLPSTTTETESVTMPGSTPVKTLSDFQPIEGKQVTLKTTKGDIVLALNREEMPLTTTNFLTLAKSGFYDGILFHRVIADFMAQAGDPNTKDPTQQALWGQGGPGYTIEDEISPTLKHDSEGILSMANTGRPNSGGSQFFITFAPTPWLDGKHAVFGEVTSGIEVLRQITQGDKIISVSIQ